MTTYYVPKVIINGTKCSSVCGYLKDGKCTLFGLGADLAEDTLVGDYYRDAQCVSKVTDEAE